MALPVDMRANQPPNLRVLATSPSQPIDFEKFIFLFPATPSSPVLPEIKTGYPGIFDKIYDTFRDPLFNHAYRIMHNPHTAEDITQETFLRALRHLSTAKEGSYRVKPWLYRITTNLCLDEKRRARLITWETDDAIITGKTAHHSTISPEDVQEIPIRKEESFSVQQVLETLAPKYRQALVLQQVDQMSCEDIGQIMGITRKAARSLLFRARLEFRNHWQLQNPNEI